MILVVSLPDPFITQVDRRKQLNWKLVVIIAFAVFLGTFFGSIVVAEIVLKIQGLI